MYVCLHMCGCILKILIEQTDTKDFKFAHVLKQIHVDMMNPSLSNSTPMNVTVDHDKQGQAAHRWYHQIIHHAQ